MVDLLKRQLELFLMLKHVGDKLCEGDVTTLVTVIVLKEQLKIQFNTCCTSLTTCHCQQVGMQKPIHPSYGRVTQNVDGCLFVWMGIFSST